MPQAKIKLVINGAAGRMGRRLLALAAASEKFAIVAAIDNPAHPLQNRPLNLLAPELETSPLTLASEWTIGADVLIDFSAPATTALRAAEAVQKNCALIIGTTGLTSEQEKIIADAAQKIPVIHSANYSLGVNLVLKIAAQMAQALGIDFNIEIAETHHNRKVDAPSGTALAIAQSICAATGRDYPHDLVNGREGKPGARTEKEIGMHALRLGGVVGDHRVYFGNDFEILELAHRAQSRDVFASGALRAAEFLAGKPAGLYSMFDVLGI